MDNINNQKSEFDFKFLDDHSRRELLERYRSAKKRLLLLDYDGTLKPFAPTPSEAVPGKELLQLIQKLNSDKNTIYLVSGRSATWLDMWFNSCNINMIAEHGARFKQAGGSWANEAGLSAGWKEPVRGIMQSYVDRCEFTFIEEKEFSLVWHYRNASRDELTLYAAGLIKELNGYAKLNDIKIKVFNGNKIVEVKNSQIDKGIAVRKVLNSDNFDFIMAIGDDYTDEDMFRQLALEKNAYTIKVGNEPSYASFNLYTPQMVISLLEMISHITD